MKIDLGSFAFGCSLVNGTGTPPWVRALGQQRPDYKFNHDGYLETIAGMLYNAVSLKDVWLPLGKGGNIVTGFENHGIQLASVFHNVFVNGKTINHPFAMIIFKESSDSHNGRRHLKYTPKISFRDKKGYVYSNKGFIDEVIKTFNLSAIACWFISELDLSTQTELYMTAHIVNPNNSMVYYDSKERKEAWSALIKQHQIVLSNNT